MFIAPLRHAILDLAESGKPFTTDAVATIGTAEPRQAKRYVRVLANLGVLCILVDGRVTPGNAFSAWADSEPKTKPGGHRKITYRAVPREAPCPL